MIADHTHGGKAAQRERPCISRSNSSTPIREISTMHVIGTCQYVNQAGDQNAMTARLAVNTISSATPMRFSTGSHREFTALPYS